MVPADREAKPESLHPNKRARLSPAKDSMQTEDGSLPNDRPKPEELASLTGTVRESSRLRNKAAMSAKAKQEASKAQLESGAQTSMQHQSQPYSTVSRQAHDPHREAVMGAARAAQRIKEACTINEDELLALRPTLLKGYASMRNQERNEALEADVKTLLYYFRHHTVDPEILKRLCFVEIVFALQSHANRLVADLAAQLINLGPWKLVYHQLRVLNAPWFEQHAVTHPEQALGSGVAAPPGAVPVPVAAAMQKQGSNV